MTIHHIHIRCLQFSHFFSQFSGADYVKKVEVMYCELCAIYLPRTSEEDVALANHCRTRNHLQRYVRYKDDRALRKEAERIHRRDKAEQEARKAQEVNVSSSYLPYVQQKIKFHVFLFHFGLIAERS